MRTPAQMGMWNKMLRAKAVPITAPWSMAIGQEVIKSMKIRHVYNLALIVNLDIPFHFRIYPM
jgi:hypothetical protein